MKSLFVVVVILFSSIAVAEELKLEVSENVEFVKMVRSGYTSIRVVYQKFDVYPQLTLEVFEKGSEGEPTKVLSNMYLLPATGQPDEPGNVENISLTKEELRYEAYGKSCTLKIDLNKRGTQPYAAKCLTQK